MPTNTLSVNVNGEATELSSGATLELPAGWRVTLVAGIYHEFFPSNDECIIGDCRRRRFCASGRTSSRIPSTARPCCGRCRPPSCSRRLKDVAGYSLRDLFIGSEGTLGIITKVLLKLIPPPAARRTLLAAFRRTEDAAATVSAIIAAKIIPCTLEFLDNVTIRCVEDYAKAGLPLDADAVLLMETDGHEAAVEAEAAAMADLARQHGATDVHPVSLLARAYRAEGGDSR